MVVRSRVVRTSRRQKQQRMPASVKKDCGSQPYGYASPFFTLLWKLTRNAQFSRLTELLYRA